MRLPFSIFRMRTDGTLHFVEEARSLDDAKGRCKNWPNYGPASTSFLTGQRENGSPLRQAENRTKVSTVTARNKLTLHFERHRRIKRWIFGVIFVVAIMVVCWLLL